MNIKLEELNEMIVDFTQIGFMTAIRAYEPPQDKLRLTEVKKWLKFNHIDLKTFKSLVSNGLIKRRRDGKCINSPLYYSKAEIKKALAVANVNGIMVNNLIKNEQ